MPIWKDIYFRCPCCRKPLAVARAAAGGFAPCPGCHARISIPKRSGIPPRVTRGAGLVLLNIAVLAVLAGGAFFYSDHNAGAPPAPVKKVSPLEKALAEKRRVTPPAIVAAASNLSATAMDDLRAKNAELTGMNARLQTQFEGMAKWVLDNYEGKYPLPLNLVSNLNLAAVSSNYTLSTDVIALLRVTPDEEAKMNRALEDAIIEVTREEMARADVTDIDVDRAKVVIAPYAKEGGAIREALLAAVEQALGRPRAEKFSDVTRDGLNQAFSHFGSAAREMQFQIIPAQDGVPSYLLISDGYQVANSESLTAYNGKQFAVMELPREYWSFLDNLPPAIRAFNKPASTPQN